MTGKVCSNSTFDVDSMFGILDPGLSEGVLCNHLCPSVRGPSVRPSLDISETALRIFLIFCMRLVHHKGTKVTEPDF